MQETMNTREVTQYINEKTGREFATGRIQWYARKDGGWLIPHERPGPPYDNMYTVKNADDFIRILEALTIEDVKKLMSKALGCSIQWGHINTACNNDMDNLFHISLPRSRVFPQDTLVKLRDALKEQLGMEVTG